ncbi:MAG TPA: hypothetical protein VFC90_10025 [Planctomycetota bacterium]|nr:hypothetical protein [Planctomycetota bacterium]
MNTNRLGPRKLDDRNRAGGRRGAPPPPRPQDRTALYTGLGVGGGILILALAYAMSSGSAPARVDRTVDRNLKEEMESAQKLAGQGKLSDALALLEAAIVSPSYRASPLLDKARTQANQYRQQIAFENEAAAAIDDFDRRITAAKAANTAMKQADAFWKECDTLLSKYGMTVKSKILASWRQDLERWRGTNAQDVWQTDYNRTKDRIKLECLDRGHFSQAVKQWRQFAEPYNAPELKARMETELRAIDHQSKEAATKLVQEAGTGAKAKATLEDAMERFMETEGQKIIAQKLKTLQ